MKITPQEIINALKIQSFQKPGYSNSSFQVGGMNGYYNNPYAISKRFAETLPAVGNRIYDMYQDNMFDKLDLNEEELKLQKANRKKAFTQIGVETGLGLLNTLGDSIYSNRVIQSQREIANRNNEYIPIPVQRYGYQSYLDNPYTYQTGGIYKKDKLGYKDISPYKSSPYLDINSNHITMDGVSQPLYVQPDYGKPRILPPNSGDYYFPNATKVREVPLKFESGGEINEDSEVYGQYNYSPFNDLIEEDTDLPFEVSEEGYENLNMFSEFMSYENSMRSRVREKADMNYGNLNNEGKGMTAAVRNNSPLNMKFSPFIAQHKGFKGRLAKERDNTYEAYFNSIEDGINAAKALWGTPAYSSKTIEEGLKRWSNNTYDKGIYKDLADIKNKKFTELTSEEKDRLIKYQSKWEDVNLYRKIYGK